MKKEKRQGLRLLALCYVLAALVWCGWCGGVRLRDTLYTNSGKLQEWQLSLADFEPAEGIVLKDDLADGGAFVSSNADPQFVYRPQQPLYVTRMAISATAKNRGNNAMAVYFTTAEDQPFSEKNKVWAQQGKDGRWVFELGGRQVYALRWDPDARGGIYWETDGVVLLNAPMPTWRYFVPGMPAVALLVLGPLWVWALVRCAVLFGGPLLARRRLQRRFEHLAEDADGTKAALPKADPAKKKE